MPIDHQPGSWLSRHPMTLTWRDQIDLDLDILDTSGVLVFWSGRNQDFDWEKIIHSLW